jgi:D-tyrosyl-tRNA(Tyr) deacylase
VSVGDEPVGAIGAGLCAFVGVTHADTDTQSHHLARRLWGLRIFPDDKGLTNRSVQDLGLQIMVVSQFTLYADTSRGRRPSFGQAAPPGQAESLVNAVADALRALGARVATGRFGAAMRVELVNDGPFTIFLEI